MRPKSIHTDSDETAFSARVRVFSRQASRIAERRFRILKCDAVLGEVRSRLRWTPTCAHARNMYVHMHAVKRCSELCGSSVLLANRWTFFRYITALCSAISANLAQRRWTQHFNARPEAEEPPAQVRVVRDRGFDEEAAVLLHGRSVSADRRLSVRCMAPSADRVSVSDGVQEFAWTYDGNAPAEFPGKVLLVACDQIVGARGHSHLEERLVVRIW